MARIRTIKPEFFTSEDIVSMSPLARLFYVSLWCEADREGRLEWKPGTFKMRYFPGDACDINQFGEELADRGLIVFYEVNNKRYAEIPTFCEHQVINNREQESNLPSRDFYAALTRESGVQAERKGKEGKGRERKGKEGKGMEGEEHATAHPPLISEKSAKVKIEAVTQIEGVPPELLAEWQSVRKKKNGTSITKTVVDALHRESALAGITPADAVRICCEKGWIGFDHTWNWGVGSSAATARPRFFDSTEAQTGLNKQQLLEIRNRNIVQEIIDDDQRAARAKNEGAIYA